MKNNIHPQYYPKSKVHCACGNIFTVGATKPEMEVDICSSCHPFYTGKEKLLDTAGRIEKFRARKMKAEATQSNQKMRGSLRRPQKGVAKKKKSK